MHGHMNVKLSIVTFRTVWTFSSENSFDFNAGNLCLKILCSFHFIKSIVGCFLCYCRWHNFAFILRVHVLLDAFAKQWKATASFVMSGCLSAWNNSTPDGRIFKKIWYLGIFRKSVEKIQVLLKSDKYRSADKSLARPTSRCILFDGENISFDASLVIYIYI